MNNILLFLIVPVIGFSQTKYLIEIPIRDHIKDSSYFMTYESLDSVDFLGYLNFELPETKFKKYSDSTIICFTDSFKIKIEEVKVDTNIYKYKFDESINQDQINGRKIYGTDWSQPKTRVSDLSIEWQGEPVRIPDSLFLDLYNPFIMKSMKFASVHTDKLNRLFLTLSGSDGAGGYDVIFIIHNGVFFKRFIAGPP